MEAINFPNYGLLEAEGEITEIQFCDFLDEVWAGNVNIGFKVIYE